MTHGDTWQVRALVKRTGLNIPSVGLSACALVKHGSANLLGACNHVREELGFPPISTEEFDELNGGGGHAGGAAQPDEGRDAPMERPTPISEDLLTEIRRRVSLRLKRQEQYLAAPKFYRAAADLCTPALRDEHWGRLREIDIEAVCDWHGIEHRKQRKAHLDRLREVRTYVKQLGPLDKLLGVKAAAPKAKEVNMHHNLQLLLQTANSVGQNTGGSASRCPPNLASIAVAVEWCKDPSLDVQSRCIAWAMPDPCSKQCVERVRLVKERIKELKLLERPKLTVPIDRELVDEVRSRLKVSVALAAAAVSKHGGNLGAACEEVRTQIGINDEESEVAAVGEVDGLQLYLSERSATGYMGVSKNASGKFFEARCSAGERSGASRLIGTYDTALAAAVGYANYRAERAANGPGSASKDEAKKERGDDEEEGEPEDDEPAVDARVPVEILNDHGDGGDGGRSQKWLVRFGDEAGGSSSKQGAGGGEEQSWVGASRIPPPMLAEYVERKRVEFNKRFEPLLRLPNDPRVTTDHPSGVVCLNVESPDALRCVAHLRKEWRDGQLPLGGGAAGSKAFGWTTYGKTLSPHDANQQRENTLLLTNVMLPAVRKHLPGFEAIEKSLIALLNDFYKTNVELFYAHGLRQGPHTLKSTGFDVHQVRASAAPSVACDTLSPKMLSRTYAHPQSPNPARTLNPAHPSRARPRVILSGHRGLRLHRVHSRGEAHARRASRGAVEDARRRRRRPLLVRQGGGRMRPLPRAALPRVGDARVRARAPQDRLLLPQEAGHRLRHPSTAFHDLRSPFHGLPWPSTPTYFFRGAKGGRAVEEAGDEAQEAGHRLRHRRGRREGPSRWRG